MGTVRRVLEIGAGTGSNALWLATQGCVVTALDLAPLAVERARARAEVAGLAISLLERDFLADGAPDTGFDLVFDRGCFHVFDSADEQARFAANVAAALAPGGCWLSLIGSTEGAPRSGGPPRRSARDIATAVEPVLSIASLSLVSFDEENPVAAWSLLARRRDVPAQPSSRR